MNAEKQVPLTVSLPNQESRIIRSLAKLTSQTLSEIVLGAIRSSVLPKWTKAVKENKSWLTEQATTEQPAIEPLVVEPLVVEPPPSPQPLKKEPPTQVKTKPKSKSDRYSQITTKKTMEILGDQALSYTEINRRFAEQHPHLTPEAVKGRVSSALVRDRQCFEQLPNRHYRVRDIMKGEWKVPLEIQVARNESLTEVLAVLLSKEKYLTAPHMVFFLDKYGITVNKKDVLEALKNNPAMFRPLKKWKGWELIK